MPRYRILLPLIALLSFAAPPLGAQTEPHAPAAGGTLAARMQAFLHEVEEGARDRVAAFFPRQGDWSWLTTVTRAPKGDRTGTWRFAGPETLRAIGPGGPVCWSFHQGGGELGPVEGSLQMHVTEHPSGWRRVGGNRFVPPGAGARSPVFVQWRREDGEWVVAAFGEARPWRPARPQEPRMVGTPAVPRDGITRDTLLVPAGAAYASDAAWYRENRPVTLDGVRYVRYGLPRRFEAGALVRVGTLERVAVHARRGDAQRPELVMVPVAPGEFQVYVASIPRPSC